MKNIRNFSIIAHIDHGKSTLADRMIEETRTVDERNMKEQVLDQMDLERERGITIKMQPVRMLHDREESGETKSYVFNLIDTPGHIDFSYEVSRALKAVEGVVLLVDSTQGIQAQTLTTLAIAKKLDLTIVPAVTKIDARAARPDETALEISEILDMDPDSVAHVSGKTGEGVTDLLDRLVDEIPAPQPLEITPDGETVGLVFDFSYSTHRGVIVYARVFSGSITEGDTVTLKKAGESFSAGEVGYFSPEPTPAEALVPGDIGYIVTGIKEPGIARVGDTIASANSQAQALSGYEEPQPVVWASVFPEGQDDFSLLRKALERLQLTDSSLSFEEESSGVLGRGFRLGLLGMLHLEIITERLRREYDLSLVVTTPSVTYQVTTKDGETEEIYAPSRFPDYGEIEKIEEPWVNGTVIVTPDYMSGVLQVLHSHSAEIGDTRTFGDGRTAIDIELPLRELMRHFFDDLKRVSSGYASFSYEIEDELREADVVVLEVLVAKDVVPAFSRVLGKDRSQREARKIVEKLKELLPRQQVATKIQAQAEGRIIASETLGAVRKNVTEDLYGGDITRKMKLREQQKRGKKRMQKHANVNIPEDVFVKMMKV